MIEIITKDGLSLDLSLSAEFEIVIENPLFDNSHIPVPFSTSISFLPSPKNVNVFGYLNAMMFEPRVKTLEASIYSCGIPLMSGVLVFDGIEDGMLNYTFNGRPKQDVFSKFIHEVPIEPAAYNINRLLEIIDGEHTTHSLPLIVNAQEVGLNDDDVVPFIVSGDKNSVPPEVKYRNYYYGFQDTPILPAVYVHTILQELNIDSSMTELQTIFNSLGILATHKEICDVKGYAITKNGEISYNLAEKLPECKVEDLLSNVMKILCSCVYAYGDKLLLMGNSEVLNSSEYDDWNDKVSDVYSLESEEVKSYQLGFKEDATGNDNYDIDEESPEVEKYPDYNSMLLAARYEYKAMERADTACVYSIKRVDARHPVEQKYFIVPLADVVYRADVLLVGESENVCDMKSDFNLVKCVPIRTIRATDNNIRHRDAICPRIDFPPLDGSRPKEVYIGLITKNQFTDNGRILETNYYYSSGVKEENTGLSLLPKELYDSYHKPYAEWLAKERSMISADVNLSEYDIHNFRIWKKVLIRSRLFMVKKLTLTLSAASGHIACRGDFVSL